MSIKNHPSKIINYLCVVATLILFCNLDVYCQEPVDSASFIINQPEPADSVILIYDQPETNETEIIIISDTSELEYLFPTEDLDSYSNHSPAKAAMMSAVVPGLGQIYNKKYWKVPVVYVAVGVSIGVFIKWQNEFNRYRRAYIDINDNNPYTNFHETLGFPPNTPDERMRQYISRQKDQLRTWRDWSIVALAITYGLNIIDANVDAHLLDFNLNDDLSLNIRPCFLGNNLYSQKIGLSLHFSF